VSALAAMLRSLPVESSHGEGTLPAVPTMGDSCWERPRALWTCGLCGCARNTVSDKQCRLCRRAKASAVQRGRGPVMDAARRARQRAVLERAAGGGHREESASSAAEVAGASGECVVCYELTGDATRCCRQSLCAPCVFSLQSPDCPVCRRKLQHRAPLPAQTTMAFGSDMMQLSDLSGVLLTPAPIRRRPPVAGPPPGRGGPQQQQQPAPRSSTGRGEQGDSSSLLLLPALLAGGDPPAAVTGGGCGEQRQGGGEAQAADSELSLRSPIFRREQWTPRQAERLRRYGLASGDYSADAVARASHE